MFNVKLIIGIMVLVAPLALNAQESVNLENLEKSYWSAKDDEFSVIQNRAFSKKKRFSLSAQYGIPINEAYSEGSTYKLMGDYYFTERVGVGIQYQNMEYVANSATQTFITEHGTVPNHNIAKNYIAGSLYFAPLYAKMSLMDKKIIYFDMGIGLHVGSLQYEVQRSIGPDKKSAMAYGVSIFQQFYLSQNWALRWDFQTLFSNQEKQRYRIGTTESEATRSLGDKAMQNTNLTVGITYWK